MNEIPRATPSASAAEPRFADHYRDHSDGTVTDIRTNLQWLRFSLGQSWEHDACVGRAQTYTWQQALEAAAALNAQGGYAGCQDWRVPAKEELQTLVYCSNGDPRPWNPDRRCQGCFQRPTIYLPAFPNTPADWYWSASTYSANNHSAWNVDFFYGGVSAYSKVLEGCVRLVRGGW
jgi:hypothetical protein